MTVDERSNDAAIDVLLCPATVVRLSTPARYGFIAVPVAFNPQTLLVVGAATVAVADRALILECLPIHQTARRLFLYQLQ
jgi:hypothetical protein